jgi:hypothetical protein
LLKLLKKCIFQGKPLDEDTVFHMQCANLATLLWYFGKCLSGASNVDPSAVIAENVRKLEARYPGGSVLTCTTLKIRQDGDL